MSGHWNTAVLVGVALVQDSKGDFSEARTERKVFLDEVTVGATAWMAARSAGLHADATVQLRACEYRGEPVLVMEGVEYDVERVQNAGDFCKLTLARRLSNV